MDASYLKMKNSKAAAVIFFFEEFSILQNG
jgi:hypothetical protein